MNENKWKNTKEKGPIAKSKAGRFEVSVWKWIKNVPQPDAEGESLAEEVIEMRRALVRYSRWNQTTRTWDDVSVWCGIDELRDLVNALDGLNFRDNP